MKSQCSRDGIACSTYDLYPNKCAICVDECFYYPKKQRKKTSLSANPNKASKRMGAKFELSNHINNKRLISAATNMTPNSGAGSYIKGDEQITGIINIMEELKTKIVPKISRGEKAFTINKGWLTKLDAEAKRENKEFWYLKFKFLESDEDSYVVVNEEIIMSMVYTIIKDRDTAQKADLKIDKYKKRLEYETTNNAALQAKIDYLQTELNELRANLK